MIKYLIHESNAMDRDGTVVQNHILGDELMFVIKNKEKSYGSTVEYAHGYIMQDIELLLNI